MGVPKASPCVGRRPKDVRGATRNEAIESKAMPVVEQTPKEPTDRRLGLSWRGQMLLVGGAALLALGVLARNSFVSGNVKEEIRPAALDRPDSPAPTGGRSAEGAFRPTEKQWANLRTAAAEQASFRTEHVADGKIAFNDDKATPVYSPYSGRVARVIARPGDVVKMGDPLFVIQANEFVQGQNDLITALAASRKAVKQLDMAQKTESRQHELYLAKAGALKDWQQSQTDLVAAQNDLRSTQIAVTAVHNRLKILGKTDEDIRVFEDTAKMDVEVTVSSPIDGTIVARGKVGLGQYIQAGATDPQYVVGDLTTVWLVANVRETDAPLMRPGETAEVRLLAYPGKLFKARISYVAPAVDPQTHRLPVRAEVDNPGGALKPEMYATFSIASSEEAQAPAVPQSAVIHEGDKAHVWVAMDGGGVVSREIRAGRVRSGMVEVLDGLKAGEKVVTGGALFVDRAAQTESEAPKS
jgi:membrane fusion protein, heavy metal efflux system